MRPAISAHPHKARPKRGKAAKNCWKTCVASPALLKTKNWQAALADIREIHFGEPDDEDNETAELLGEAFTEWRISNTDYESPEQILDEAYYSVNCDYYLAAYLQYPLFRSKPDNDFLRPYFDLWQQGYGFALGEDCLYLYR